MAIWDDCVRTCLSSLQVPQVVCDLHGWGQETPAQKVTA